MKYVRFLLQAGLGGYFTWLGLLQLVGPPPGLQADFIRWGYALWFITIVGAVEFLGGVGMLIGLRLAWVGALAGLWLGATMLGAILTHLNAQDGGWPLPLILLALCLIIVRAHWAALRDFVRQLKP
jgi:hypothetical protein